MINLFWDEAHSTWEIASRKNIGCNYWYFKDPAGGISKQLYSERPLGISTLGNAVKQLYSERPLGKSTLGNADAFRKQLTFREMFLEALAIGSLADLETDADFAFLNKECSYSFVLQHPQNHLVELIEKPAAYMTYIYRIEHKDGQPFYSYVKPDQTAGNGRIRYPVDEHSGSTDVSPYGVSSFVGSMIINYETGMRRTYYREEYLELKALRGNNPSIYYQYLTLRKIQKVADFLICLQNTRTNSIVSSRDYTRCIWTFGFSRRFVLPTFHPSVTNILWRSYIMRCFCRGWLYMAKGSK